ncbi:hypothetical protein PR002_g27493 [Phytophthora rubi]|uniref:RxLR effector protein n=1 Tax=Phytophthora rubi TaxID=129364 RepID=A0A6A3HI22_9STRA|nr:hypothetical protein PR002_g27493 [Phytophthora rubi]
MIWYLRFAVPGVLALFVVSESTAETENPKTPLADASPVKLHVTLRRKAMELHGESEFDVFANPVVSGDGKKSSNVTMATRRSSRPTHASRIHSWTVPRTW